MVDLIEKAFRMLYPDKEFKYGTKVSYSGKFSSYGANVRLHKNVFSTSLIEFRLSSKFKDVDEDIVIGLIQDLLLKVFNDKKTPRTTQIDFYNSFVKHLSDYNVVDSVDPELLSSFERVNEKYFFSRMETPNLVWGQKSYSKLGSYDYKKDAITISTIFRGDTELLDYVMYHEMLHKKLKFNNSGSKTFYHTVEFKRLERQFEGFDQIETRLAKFIRSKKRIRFW